MFSRRCATFDVAGIAHVTTGCESTNLRKASAQLAQPISFARPLPGWAKEIGCASWAEAFLKFVLSQPVVTCAIPATSKVAHLRENMRALGGVLPDAALRARIATDYERL